MAELLGNQSVDLLICGGIGGGAQTALADAGVEVCSGAVSYTHLDVYKRQEMNSTKQ